MSIRLLIEKLKDIDMEWRALGEIGEFTYGHVAKAQESGNARFVRITDIDNQGQLIATDPKYVDINEENERFILKKSDLLMARTGATYGKTMIFDEDYPAIYAGFLIKISLDEQLVVPRFYWHFAQSQFFWNQANKLASGGGQPQFNANVLREVEIPIPCPDNPKKSLDIQAEIVRILDTFTELTTELTARKKQYNYYRDQLLSFEKEEVEWKTLGELTSLITKGTTPKSFESSGIAFIKTEAFDGTRVNKSKLSYVDETIHRTFLKRSILEEDDILFTIAGATIGKSAVVTSDLLPANTNQALAIIRLHQTVNNKYIFYILRSNYMKEYIEKCAKGSAQPNLNLRQINEFCIPLPSPEEQTRIVTILDKFDALTNSITEGLPREIALRQKQYEYYRDLLLSFPKTDAEVAA